MKNNIEQYEEIERPNFPDEVIDKKPSIGTVRADESFSAKNAGLTAQPAAQDSDCWGDLWQGIRGHISRFFNRKRRIKTVRGG